MRFAHFPPWYRLFSWCSIWNYFHKFEFFFYQQLFITDKSSFTVRFPSPLLSYSLKEETVILRFFIKKLSARVLHHSCLFGDDKIVIKWGRSVDWRKLSEACELVASVVESKNDAFRKLLKSLTEKWAHKTTTNITNSLKKHSSLFCLPLLELTSLLVLSLALILLSYFPIFFCSASSLLFLSQSLQSLYFIRVSYLLSTNKHLIIYKKFEMSFLRHLSLLLLILIAYSQINGCPQLCANNCYVGSCQSCYLDFTSTSSTSSTSCTCPAGMFSNPYVGLCEPCPVQCQTCTNASKCLTCISGYMLSNSYTCIVNTTTENNWVSKRAVSNYTNFMGVGPLSIVTANQTLINITNSNFQAY